MGQKQKRTVRHFSNEFKLQAARRFLNDGLTQVQAAAEAGVHTSALRRWVAQAKAGEFSAPAVPVQAPLLEEPAPVESEPQRPGDKALRSGYYLADDPRRQRAVAEHLSGEKSSAQLAKELGVTPTTILNWVKVARGAAPPSMSARYTSQPKGVHANDPAAIIADLRRQLAAAERMIGRLTIQLQATLEP